MDAWLERCGLLQKKNQYARSLSSGEQQKLSFIRALVFDPAFVIVDETLSNLDPDSTELFEQLMREQQTKNKMTWLLISHQLGHVRKICDQVHFMEQGKKSFFTPLTRPYADIWQIQRFHIAKMKKVQKYE